MAQTIKDALSGNTYPGRGIIIGQSADAKTAVIIYFIMGRSVNSRNRMFEQTDDGIRTVACDPEKLSDPSLVIYHPIREIGDKIIVTNGDQTDTIRDYLRDGKSFYDACLSRTFEPDPPIWTPRISGMLERDGSYRLAIVKNIGGDMEMPLHCFYEYTKPVAGAGHFIRTYERDGNPPPSFSGEPIEVEIDLSQGADAFMKQAWNALDADNRISLCLRELEIGTGKTACYTVNKYGIVMP